MHKHNTEHAAKIGHDKSHKHIHEVVDAHVGTYKCNVCDSRIKSDHKVEHSTKGFSLHAKEGK